MEALAERAHSALTDFVAFAGGGLIREQVRIEVVTKPHKPSGLPKGKMAVYCFVLGDQVLKVGLAGPNSDARYRSQHYNLNSAGSNLAKSLVTYPERIGAKAIDSDRVGEWIKQNTDRVNFLLPAALGKPLLAMLEAFLHARWAPVYEGRMWS
jgi:hypothetical protein